MDKKNPIDVDSEFYLLVGDKVEKVRVIKIEQDYVHNIPSGLRIHVEDGSVPKEELVLR